MRSFIIGALALFLLFGAVSPQATDFGVKDTVVLLGTRPAAGADDSTFKVELWVWHDVSILNAVALGYQWDNLNVTIDTAWFNTVLYDTLGTFPIHTVFLNASKQQSQDNRVLALGLTSFGLAGISPTDPPSRGTLPLRLNSYRSR
jgi:hypothetical protein